MGKVGHVLLALLVSFEFTHTAAYFLILEGDYCWKFMKSMYFVPEGAMLILIVIFTVLPKYKGKGNERLSNKI